MGAPSQTVKVATAEAGATEWDRVNETGWPKVAAAREPE